MPKRCASSFTASAKPIFSCSSRNLKTSPPAPQPKQWKNPLSRLTWNDGVFSPWNGQSPLYVAPALLQRHVVLDHDDDVGVLLQVVDEPLRETSATLVL